jgi:hypothetical protein
MARLRVRVAVEAVAALTPKQLAGRYANPTEELKHAVPPLVGNNLYLFPDRTYIYCEWANIMPNTIFDKGTWTFATGIIELKSDRDVTWNPDLERRFLAVRRPSHAEFLLIGADRAVRRIDNAADPNAMLLIVAKQRERTITRSEAAGIKGSLMRGAWRPKSFGPR